LTFCREYSDALRDVLNVQPEVASFSQGKIFSLNDISATRENIISAKFIFRPIAAEFPF
jgi:hypothetical protein